MTRSVRTRITQVVLIAGFIGWFGYPIYAWITYSGPFRWLAELEMAQFGAYDPKATVIALFVAMVGLPVAIIIPADRAIRRLRGVPSTKITVPTGAPRTAPNPKVQSRAMLVVALVAIVVAAGAGALGYLKLQEAVTFEPLNLADGGQPRSSHVELTGVAVPSMQVQFEETINGTTTTTTYIPLLPPRWNKADPIVYFLRPHADIYGQN